MKKDLSRRNFLTQVTAAGVAGPLILPRLSLANPASSRLQHAAIGVGGQGASDLGNIFSSGKVDVIALCDVDEINLRNAAALHPKARLYRDWREMLEQEEKHIDSVNVSTPDHTHAPACMTAIRKGKHIFCEKPLTRDVYEARKVTLAARKQGVATQLGNQIHSHEAYRTAVRWIQDGVIGKVKEWHSWVGAVYTTPDKKNPSGSDPVPETLDWNLWLGVAPVRPYVAKDSYEPFHETYHPFWWRRFRDFGGGSMGDFGCHIFDPVFTALNILPPLSITVEEAESYSEEVWPEWIRARWIFPGTALTTGDTILGTWTDGGKKPSVEHSPHLPRDRELPSSGSYLVGEEGTMVIPHVGMPRLYPEEKFATMELTPEEGINHYHEFVESALGNGVCGSNFDYAGPLTEAVLLANIANRFPGETLQWNAKRMRFTNKREANQYLRRKYRKGFEARGL